MITGVQILRISYWPDCSRGEDSGSGGNGGGSISNHFSVLDS